jgi:hypothetical protein
LENLTGRGYLEYIAVDGRIILKCILKKCGLRFWTGFIWLRIDSIYGLFTIINKTSKPIQDTE